MTPAFPGSRRQTFFVRVALVSTGVGFAVGWVVSDGQFDLLDTLLSGLIGFVIGSGATAFELFVVSRRVARKLPTLAMMVLRGLAYSAIIVAALSTPSLVTGGPLPWRSPGFAEVFGISALVAFAFSTLSEMTRLLGREATVALLFGRYVRPRLETRIVLIADLVGSTSLAERIGELNFHNCLRDVMLDLSVAIDATRGNVHRYVGDAVFVTWPLATGVAQGACLTCAEQMHAELHRRRAFYLDTYGVAPRLRIALHCGQLAAGEIGDWKKEIALLGDTMNTTARLEVAAKENGVATVLSDDLCRRLPPDRSGHLRRLPAFTAQGKERTLALWTVDQAS